MPEPNLISYNSLITGLTHHAFHKESVKLFWKKQKDYDCLLLDEFTLVNIVGSCASLASLFLQTLEEGVRSSAPTYVSVLSACADMALIERGKQTQGHIIRKSSNGYLTNVYISNALIDMYSKCGDMKSAENLFKTTPLRDIISWNTLITGLALNDRGDESLALFKRIIEAKVKPNHVTFLGLLSACNHAGLDNEGIELKDNMEKQYGVKPRLDHYGISIDLLGRKTRLEEALDLVERNTGWYGSHRHVESTIGCLSSPWEFGPCKEGSRSSVRAKT